MATKSDLPAGDATLLPGPPNGIEAATGAPRLDYSSLAELLARLRQEALPLDRSEELRRWSQAALQSGLGPIDGVKPESLEETGWGVVFAAKTEPEIREALRPLLDHRRRQAGELYRELEHRGESKERFLASLGAGPGPVDPSRVPYYLLLVGGIEEIPLGFQYQLDVQYAVGRLHFDGPGRIQAYRTYADRVVAAETRAAPSPKRVVLFGTAHPGDSATELTHDHLLQPLGRFLHGRSGPWTTEMFAGAAARKERLVALLGRDAPALLVTTQHGVLFGAEDPRQRGSQGALLCQDWKGPGNGISPDCYVTADDLAGETDRTGLLVLLFSCFSAGTPRHNNFVHRGPEEPAILAAQPFLAALPQKLLSQGALAVVGHVDRMWGYSFYWPRSGQQLPAFRDALSRLLEGKPLGWAMESFNLRYAELAVDLFERPSSGTHDDELEEVALSTAFLDARNYVVLGDPAVRIGRPVPGVVPIP